jgi:hypothetical protein
MNDQFEKWWHEFEKTNESNDPRAAAKLAWIASRAALQGHWPDEKPGVNGIYCIKRERYDPTLAWLRFGGWWAYEPGIDSIPIADQHKPFAWFGPITFQDPPKVGKCDAAFESLKLFDAGGPFYLITKDQASAFWRMAQEAKE